MVSFDDVARAHERIKPQAKRTPVLTSATVDALTGASVFFKCENFQRMGAFKFRGAYNALSQLDEREAQRGVVAYSSGNHAQAVALAGKLLGIKTVIVMPHDAPQVKLEATRGYGAEVVHYDQARGPRGAGGQARRRARPDADPALRPPAHHRRPGHRGEGADRGRRPARRAARAVRRRRAAVGLRDRRQAPGAGVPRDRRRAGGGRRRHAVVREEAPDQHRRARHHRRRRAHAVARQAHLPDRAALRRRHAHRDRRRAHARHVLPVGAHEDRGRAHRRARRLPRCLEKKSS